MFRFSIRYFTYAIILFLVEVFIGFYMSDAYIRPYGGDFLVVILLYCLVKSFVNTPTLPTASYVLVIAYAIEISQYFHLISLLGLQNASWARMVLACAGSANASVARTVAIFRPKRDMRFRPFLVPGPTTSASPGPSERQHKVASQTLSVRLRYGTTFAEESRRLRTHDSVTRVLRQ